MPMRGKTLKGGRRRDRKMRDRMYARKAASDPAQAKARKIRSTLRWQRLRALVRRAQPLCPMCEAEGRIVPATQVHHQISVAERPDLAFQLSNLVALCAKHHAEVERGRAGPKAETEATTPTR